MTTLWLVNPLLTSPTDACAVYVSTIKQRVSEITRVNMEGWIITGRHVAEYLSSVNTHPIECGVRKDIDVVPGRESLRRLNRANKDLAYHESFWVKK
jgi:hypothetical protein